MGLQQKIITASPDSLGAYLRKVWQFRALVLAFARKDIQVRFAQTWLRLGWSVLQPLTATAVFTFFFGYVLHWKTGNIPFPVYALSGLIGWNLFTNILHQGSGGVHEASALVRKIYFPKLVIPLSKMLMSLLDLGIGLLLLVPLLIVYGVMPSWRLIFLPLVLGMNLLAAFALVCFFTAFSYKNRDLLLALPFLTYFGIWLTPVFFTFDTLPEQLQFAWYLNPMAGIVEAWRACLFAGWNFDLRYLPAMLAVLPLAITGLWIFQRKESEFSDFV